MAVEVPPVETSCSSGLFISDFREARGSKKSHFQMSNGFVV
jgi:hypothetical protein